MIETRAENVLNLKDAQDMQSQENLPLLYLLLFQVSICFMLFFMCGTITLKYHSLVGSELRACCKAQPFQILDFQAVKIERLRAEERLEPNRVKFLQHHRLFMSILFNSDIIYKIL